MAHVGMFSRAVAGALLAIGGTVVAIAAHNHDHSILPIPSQVSEHAARVALGERLFHDARLSRSGTLACASCHPVASGGMDGRARSITSSGEPDVINTPTVFNAAFNARLTWRGAFETLEQQAEADLGNPRHAATTWDELLPKLAAERSYEQGFRDAYADGLTRFNVLDALASYQRALITPNARFDRYLRGDKDALSPNELKGYRLFRMRGCVACHQGINIGGNLFQRIGIFGNYFEARGTPITDADLGRFLVTGNESDKHVFRVPSLRNVAVTAPYFHDGSVATLEQAVALMARHQLGQTLPPQEIHLIAVFLRTLTGEYQGKPLGQ